MSHHIEKDNPNRWFLIQNSGTSEPSIVLFGSAGDQGVNVLVTGQPNLLNYLTEDELETEVIGSAGIRKKTAQVVERLLISFADIIFVVSDSIAKWYKNQYNLKEVHIIRNIPNKIF